MEFIYIAYNPLLPGMVKIGRTKNLDKRLVELSQILPESFQYVKTYEVDSSASAEKFIHKALTNMRANENREFFKIESHEQIITICDELLADYSHFYLKDKYKSIMRLDDNRQIAAIIKGTRLAKQITQEELSKKSQVSHATIARIESGKTDTTIDTLIKLLDILECNIYIGLGEDKEKIRRRVRKYYNTKKD